MSHLNKEEYEQMAAGTWQHHHRHPIKERWGTYMRWVNSQKTTWLSTDGEDRISFRGAEYWPLSLWALMQSNIWQTTPFHLRPCSNLNSVNRLRTHQRTTPLNNNCFLCFILCLLHGITPASFFPPFPSPLLPSLPSSSSPTLSSCYCSSLPIYSHLHRPHSPPNRQGCCGWHVSSWEQPCRVDGPKYTERRAPQPGPVFVCVCSCVC